MSEKDRNGSFILSSQVELRFETQCIDLDIFIKENLYSHSGELRNGSSLHARFYDLIFFFQYLPLFYS